MKFDQPRPDGCTIAHHRRAAVGKPAASRYKPPRERRQATSFIEVSIEAGILLGGNDLERDKIWHMLKRAFWGEFVY